MSLLGKIAGNLPNRPDSGQESQGGIDQLVRQNGVGQADREDVRDDVWYHPDEVDGLRWDQQFPYQLLVVDQAEDGTVRQRGDWKYTLPIPPDSLSITTPYAITTIPTQGGIVEEHNSAPLRQIEVAGTTGVLPARPRAGQPPRPSLVASIFSGTIRAAGAAVGAARDVARDLTGDRRAPPNLIPQDLLDDLRAPDSLLLNTGYFQARTMARFVEAYANFKMTPTGRSCALALACWKEEAVYLVTPVRVAITRDKSSPLEYFYRLSFTAWARPLLGGPGPLAPRDVPDPASPDTISEILDVLTDARRVLQDARATISAVISDADRTIFEPVREAILLCKDALAIPLALVDLPASVVRDAADTVVAAVAAGKDVVDFGAVLGAAGRASKQQVQDDLRRIRDVLAPSVKDRTTVSTRTGAITGQAAATPAGTPRAPRPALDVFDRPDQHADVLAALRPDRLDLPKVLVDRIAGEVARVKALTQKDLEDRREALRTAGARFEDLVGAGDAAFASTFGLPAPAAGRPLSVRNFRAATGIHAGARAYDGLVARSPRAADASVQAALEAYAGRAAASGIAFKVPRSKIPVPFQYGATLEQLALRYLGSADRVPEIVALNGLRAPYVDEEGLRLALLAPGAGRDVVVADSPDLVVGQAAYVESAARPRTKRKVVGVERRNGQATVTLDGAEDLDQYSTLQDASLHVFLPGTVNSQAFLFIPSDEPPDGSFRVEGVAPASAFDPVASAAGVDLLLTPDNDLVVTQDGDGRWATGIQNIVQQFRILVQLRRGELLHHPSKGLNLRPGESIADASAQDVVKAIRECLSQEAAFGAVRSITVRSTPPSVLVEVAVEVAGANVVLPLSVDAVR